MDGPSASAASATSANSAAASSASPIRRRRRIAARIRLDFWLDAVLLVGYTLAYSYGFTGIGIHEWLGIGLGLILLVHLTLHWDWVIRTTKRLFSPRGHDKLIWAVNLALLFAMVLCVASGILISRVALPFLGINVFGSPFWERMHILTAEVTLGLVPVHVALRWRWILRVGRRLLTRTGRRA
jgi:Domain of unknown function (DUF4405)